MSNDIKIKVTADASNAHNELGTLGKEVGSLDNKTRGASKSVDGLSHSMDDAAQSSNKLQKENKQTSQSLADIKKISAAAAVAVGSFVVLSTNHLIDLNRELKVAEAQLGVGADQLQIWGIAAERFNIPAEKMRDMLKDVSEKLGDMATSGGGEAVDVIKRLNLDINELINLSPDQALLKIAGALETVDNISQHDKVFLLESLASDASALLPMLEDNAKALRDVEEIAQRRGTIITAEESALLSQADAELQNIKGALGGVAQEAGLAGAELLVAFGPGIADAIDHFSISLEDFIYDIKLVGDAWSHNLTGMSDDTYSFASKWVSDMNQAGEEARLLFTYLPVYSQAAYSAMLSYGKSWKYDTMSYYELVKSVSAYAFAGMVEYGGNAFASLVDIGGKALGWLIDQFADLIDSMGVIGELPGMESFGAKFDSAATSIRSAANSAKSFGDDVRSSMQSATASIRSNADASLASAIQYSAQAEAAKQAASAVMQQADDYVSAKEGQRDIDKQLRDENREFGDMSERAYNKAGKATKAYTAATQDAAGAAKSAAKAKDELTKASERSAQAFESEYNKLTEENIKLSEGEAAAYAFAKGLQGIDEAHIAVLQGMIDANDELAKQKKLIDEANKAYKKEIKSLDDQEAKLKLTEKAYRKYQLASEGVKGALADEIIQREGVVASMEKQKEETKRLAEETKQIGDNLAESISDKLLGGTASWSDILKNWWGDIKSYFAKNVLQPIIQPFTGAASNAVTGFFGGGSSQGVSGGINPASSGGLGSLSSVGGLFTKAKGLLFGKQIGTGIASFGEKIGTSIFSKAAGVSNWQFLGGGILGGIIGGIGQKGTYGSIGGSIGATIGTAIMPGIGTVLGALGGGLIGGLFGGKWETTAKGVALGYTGGEFTGKQFEDKKKKGGWLRGTKYDTVYTKLDEALATRLDTIFDNVEANLVKSAEFFGKNSAQSVIDGFSSGFKILDKDAARSAAEKSIGAMRESTRFFFDGTEDEYAAETERLIEAEVSALQRGVNSGLDKVKLDGLSESEAEAAIAEWVAGISDKLYKSVYGSQFDKFARDGESLSETVNRIYANITVVDAAFDTLGLTMEQTGFAAAEMSQGLVDAAGGIENFTASTSYYYDNFYSEEEKRIKLIENLSVVLSDFNSTYGASVTSTKSSLRSFVEGLDVTTEAGQKAFAAAMQLAPALNSLADAESKASKDILIENTDLFKRQLGGVFDKLKTANDALEKQYAEQIATYQRLQSIAVDIRRQLSDIRFGSTSALSTADQLSASKTLFDSTYNAALGGDEVAAKSLNTVGKQYLELQKNLSVNANEYLQTQADVGNKMELVAEVIDGSHASVLPYVPFDGYRAELHKGGSVIDASQMFRQYGVNNQPQQQNNNAEIIAELKALRASNAEMRRELKEANRVIVFNTARSAKKLEQFDDDGMPEQRTA